MIKKEKKKFSFFSSWSNFWTKYIDVSINAYVVNTFVYIFKYIYNVMFVNIYIYIIEFPQYIYNLILSLIFLQFL